MIDILFNLDRRDGRPDEAPEVEDDTEGDGDDYDTDDDETDTNGGAGGSGRGPQQSDDADEILDVLIVDDII
jgi:hypothetical protein